MNHTKQRKLGQIAAPGDPAAAVALASSIKDEDRPELSYAELHHLHAKVVLKLGEVHAFLTC